MIKWYAISEVGVACGCDGKGGNKCVIVLGRYVREFSDVKPFKSSSAAISSTCDSKAKEVEVKLRDVSQYIMD